MFNKKIEKKIIIEGMMCEHCKSKVETTLKTLKEVTKVKISLKNKSAIINLNNELDNKIIIDLIENLGYKVTSIK